MKLLYNWRKVLYGGICTEQWRVRVTLKWHVLKLMVLHTAELGWMTQTVTSGSVFPKSDLREAVISERNP